MRMQISHFILYIYIGDVVFLFSYHQCIRRVTAPLISPIATNLPALPQPLPQSSSSSSSLFLFLFLFLSFFLSGCARHPLLLILYDSFAYLHRICWVQRCWFLRNGRWESGASATAIGLKPSANRAQTAIKL